MRRSNQSGFTMIELLIVIAIIGLLAAVAISRYAQYKDRAYDAETKGSLHGVFIACKAYWHDQGSNQSCSATIAAQTTYGFIAGSTIVLTGGGTENGFAITGSNSQGGNSYTLNSAGNIS